MAFHQEGDCSNCGGLGVVVDEKDQEAVYNEADRLTDRGGFMSFAMAMKKLYKSGKYDFHTCPVCNGTGKGSVQ